MTRPTSHQELKSYILRQLGAPVIEINIADEQLDDAIDNSLDMWNEYHSDGTSRRYIAHCITQEDFDNKYIPLPASVYTVNRVYTGRENRGYSGADYLTSGSYQITISELYHGGSIDLGGYYIAKQYTELLKDTLSGYTISTYKRYERKLYIETSWERLSVGSYIMIDTYSFNSPDEFPAIYGDRVFRHLATAYAKKQWGTNLSKFKNVALPGGMVLNGEAIFFEGQSDVDEIESTFRRNYSDPDLFFVG